MFLIAKIAKLSLSLYKKLGMTGKTLQKIFQIVLLKVIPVSCVHGFYIQNHAQSDFSVKLKIKCDFVVKLLVDLVTITRFTYVSKKKKTTPPV